MKQFELRWTCVLSTLTFPKKRKSKSFVAITKSIISQIYLSLLHIYATYLKRKLIQIQRQTLRTDTRHLQWAPKWWLTLSRSFSWLTLINNYYMRALTNHFSVRDLGIFPVWTLPETEINNFNHFTSSFRTTINFTLELSSKQIVFLDTEVFKGPRFIQTHFETS